MFASVGQTDFQIHFTHTHTKRVLLLLGIIKLPIRPSPPLPLPQKNNYVIRWLFLQGFADHTHIRKLFNHPLPETVPHISSQQLNHPTAYATSLHDRTPNSVWPQSSSPASATRGGAMQRLLHLTSTRTCRQEGGNEASSMSERPLWPRQNAPTRVPSMRLSPSKSFLSMLKLPDKLL